MKRPYIFCFVSVVLAMSSCKSTGKRTSTPPITDIRIIDVLTRGHPFDGGDELAANAFAEELLTKRGREGQFTVYVVPFRSYYRVLFVPEVKDNQMPSQEASEIASELIDFMEKRAAAPKSAE